MSINFAQNRLNLMDDIKKQFTSRQLDLNSKHAKRDDDEDDSSSSSESSEEEQRNGLAAIPEQSQIGPQAMGGEQIPSQQQPQPPPMGFGGGLPPPPPMGLGGVLPPSMDQDGQQLEEDEIMSNISSYVGSDLSPEEIQQKKKTLLYKLKRFQRKGFVLSRPYNLDSELIDIQAEVDSIKREANLGATVATMKKGLTITSFFLESMNSQFDLIGAKLDGWSNQVKDDVDHGDYDEVFEELYDKYTDRFQLPPELRLVSMLATSALQYHVAQIVVSRTLSTSKADDIIKQNPKIKQDIFDAVAKQRREEKQQPQVSMQPPSDIENILKELDITDDNPQLSTNF